MKSIHRYLADKEDIRSIIDGIEMGMNEQLVAGLAASARSMLVSAVKEAANKPILLITHHLSQAQQLYDDLLELTEDVYLYPVNELIGAEIAVSSPELRGQRIEALNKWLKKETGILVAPVQALRRFLPPIEYWKNYELIFTTGEEINLETTLKMLIHMGYESTSMVTKPGEFSRRGGIIDIYPITEEYPIRIELFDVEVDSIRYFDAESQRSLEEQIQSVIIGPASELLLTEEDIYTAAERLEEALSFSLKKVKESKDKEALMEVIEQDISRLKNLERFQEMYKYIGYFYEEPESLIDYLPANGVIILDEMSRIEETAVNLDKEEAEWYSNLLETNRMVRKSRFSFEWQNITDKMTQMKLYLSVFLRHIPNTQPQNIVNLSSRQMQEFHGQMNLLKNEMNRWKKGGNSVVILAPNQQRAEKLHSILADYQIEATVADKLELPVRKPTIVIGQLHTGVEWPLHKLVVITENELFKKRMQRKRRRQKITNAERIKSYQELKAGDYVVHTNHGVGKYLGIETLEVNKLHRDFMKIKYSGDDTLFVPVDQIDLVQKYVGAEGKEPKLYKLGGTEWKKVKSRVQSSVEDIADELIKLYAEREAKKGYAFSPDTEMQREFEAAFPYQETEDQLRSIDEIKRDMERDRPMDRLLCGDVGYGKTEVAIRAAFKAIMDGKQVAMLVPTTILAQQHYETILERFQDYPINIGLLSRFRTRKEQTETTKGLKKGTVDIVIGTHRLLSKDVEYHDLGLLIVDEEQRFGVKHKEKIKQMKTNVDVLTLTATPIPRTLHMSMLGVRDLSVLETPPENRFPIQTYVMEYNPILVREAIEREMARNGQVFFLNNRVETIDKIARDLTMLVPEARIATAHGQMNEKELENVILSFLEGEFDVLVSTSIIETGVDIPNVNTLIVNNADWMGLSQLYQLRGRVGRSNRVAYAYFTYQRDRVLTEVAEQRLQAIKEFTELGSGFKIAMRDLSIRGTGNILGSQQHGFIDSVGFDLYSQMLTEAIEARKSGQETTAEKPFEPEININIDAYIPDSYIHDEKQKIDIYKQFQTFTSEEDKRDLQDELIDRFGQYPQEVENLFLVSTMKMYAKQQKIEQIVKKNKKVHLLIEEERSRNIDGAKLFSLTDEFGRNVQFGTDNDNLKITFTNTKEKESELYSTIVHFIKKLEDVDRT
jgi:transcription-repair coupling factor (superfamily II helicase)